MTVDTDIPDWVANTPSADIHNLPGGTDFTLPFSPVQLLEIGGQLIEQFLRHVVEAVVGFFIPGAGPAFDQLFDWAHDLGTAAWSAFNNVADLISGVGGTVIHDVSAAINGVVGGLASLVNNLLHNAGAVIGAIPQGLVTGLTNVISGINSAITAASNFIQQVIDAILSALRGIPIIGGLIPDLNKAVKAQKVDQQNFTISAIVSDARNPSWVCRYPISDVTYPEFLNNSLDVFGTTDTASTGTAHTHTIGNTNTADAETSGWSVYQNESRGSYLTITNDTVHDTVGVMVFKDSGTLNHVYLEVFKENTDGSIDQVFSQEFSSSITTTNGFYEFTLTDRLIVQAGERFLIRIRNSSTVATTVWLTGLTLVDGSIDVGFKTVGATDTGRTSYTSSQCYTARAAGDTLNWFMLAAKDMPQVDRSFSDDANRLSIGGLWARTSTTAALLDIYEESFGYTGSLDGDQAAIYIHACSRDVNRVEANLTLNPLSTARCGVLLHCSRNFDQMVYLGVDGSTSKIFSGPFGSLAERASLNVGGTGKWSLYYDEDADKYVALKDGTDIGLSWNSVGAYVRHGADYRFGGQQVSLASGEAAGTIDDWMLRDWYIAVSASTSAPPLKATAVMPDAVVTAGVNIAAPAMVAVATMPVPTVSGEVALDTAPMTAVAVMPDADVSNNSKLPYSFDFTLG